MIGYWSLSFRWKVTEPTPAKDPSLLIRVEGLEDEAFEDVDAVLDLLNIVLEDEVNEESEETDSELELSPVV